MTADIAITGADVYTVDASRRWAGAVAVKNRRITAVGSEADVRGSVGDAREVLHVPGRLVLPGMQDSHVHVPFAGRYRLHVSLHDLPGIPAYLDAVARYSRAHPDEEWIYGGGWAMEHFPGGAPTKEVLDEVERDRPVFLVNRDIHGAWVNSRALELAGITRETPDPPDGRYERDAHGAPTGTLHEGAFVSFHDRFLPAPSADEWERAILAGQSYLHSLGIVGWQDAWVLPPTLRAYLALESSGALTGHVVASLWWDRHRGEEQIDDLVAQRAMARGEGVRATTVKIMIDGVLENRTAALIDPYLEPDGPGDDRGLTYVDAEALASAVTHLDALGFQVHMHAIGDRAARSALDAIEAAQRANGRRDARHHVAHLQVVQPSDVPRFRELGVAANCQPYWAQIEPQMTELTVPFLGPDRADLQYPFRSLHDAGATLAFGSDWSVTTPDPFQLIEVAVTRVDPEHRDGRPFLPHERLELPDAIAAFTMGSAFVQRNDRERGSIEVGKSADLVVVDRNIFAEGPVGDARVELTMVDGRVVHDVAR